MNTRLKEFFKVHKGNQLYDLAITIYFYMQNGHGTKHVSMKLCPRRVRSPDRNDMLRKSWNVSRSLWRSNHDRMSLTIYTYTHHIHTITGRGMRFCDYRIFPIVLLMD